MKLSLQDKCFTQLLQNEGLTVVPEYRFCKERRWRADFCINDKLLIEVEGGIFTNGRHTRSTGFIADMEKYNKAVELGFTILRYSRQNLTLPATIAQIKNTLLKWQSI